MIIENNKEHYSNITDNIQIIEKSSGDSIWKSYCIKINDLKKDIPGEYIDPPYILKYKNKFVLT
uniref:hypothetical protein n=3 Tax=Bacteria TaxID=2 RepID=UPI003AB13701